ncbi:MAG: sterol-binding protein [Methylococcales bacterium]|nr:sterol-binding protein [Methylococcales bacterium]
MKLRLLIPLFVFSPTYAAEPPSLLGSQWAKQACIAWNKDEQLTYELADTWIENRKNPNSKVLQLYRDDCPDSPHIELQLKLQDIQALCIYGGKDVHNTQLNDVDFVLHTSTAKWQEMGNSEYGPAQALLYDRLHLEGSKQEALDHLTSFESFLLLIGKVPSITSCPKY